MSDTEEFPFYGTALELFDEDNVPKKKAFTIEDQIATDAQGRRRFHGAFTGGFSAGFFNTVGSLEGWLPSEFKSSRAEKAEKMSQKPEDFMDEEDIGQFGIAPKQVRATDDFDNVVKRKRQMQSGPIPGVPVLETLLQPARETVGVRLLKKMGWKPGQGVGARVTKKEKRNTQKEIDDSYKKVYGCEVPDIFRKTVESDCESSDEDLELTFAPDDYEVFIQKPKTNTCGMSYTGLDKNLFSSHVDLFNPAEFRMKERNNKVIAISGTAFGVGAFENEDEDIYSRDDMSKYDFELDPFSKKTKKQPKTKTLNEDFLEGFVPSKNPILTKKSFPLPVVPKNFIPKHGVRISRFEPLPETHEKFNVSRNKKFGRHDLTASDRSRILNSENKIISSKSETKPDIGFTPAKTVLNPSPIAENIPKSGLHFLTLNTEKDSSQKTSSEEQSKPIETLKNISRVGLIFDKFVPALNSDADVVKDLKFCSSSVYLHGTEEMRKAAKEGQFGQLTRQICEWKPNGLLCRRFNVPEPDVSNELPNAKKRTKSSILSYYEAYQQNNPPKIGPANKIEELPILEEEETGNPLVSETNSTNNENEPNMELQSTETATTVINTLPDSLNTTNIVQKSSEDIIENLPSTSKQIPEKMEIPQTVDATVSKPEISKPILNLPAPVNTELLHTADRIDLFKAIFLSSSESESEKEEEEEKTEEKLSEYKKIIMQRNEPTKIASDHKGLFSDLDLSKIITKSTDVVLKIKPNDDTAVEKKEKELNPDMYGPTLPSDVKTNKVTFDKKPDQEQDEWVEIKEDKHRKKHKKSDKVKKSKHKSHKSKHKKKKR